MKRDVYRFLTRVSIVRLLSVVFFTLSCPHFTHAAPGDLDTTFGTSGKVTTDLGSSFDAARAMVIQPDGKIIVAGTANGDFALARYNADGSLDLGFGSSGKVITDLSNFFSTDEATAIALQKPDGKIVVAGSSSLGGDNDFVLARYNSDGNLDNTFGVGGIVITDFSSGSSDKAFALALQVDGRMVVAGSSEGGLFGLIRYNPDGSLDVTFGSDGKVTTSFGAGSHSVFALAIQQTNGRIVAGGFFGSDSALLTMWPWTKMIRYLQRLR